MIDNLYSISFDNYLPIEVFVKKCQRTELIPRGYYVGDVETAAERIIETLIFIANIEPTAVVYWTRLYDENRSRWFTTISKIVFPKKEFAQNDLLLTTLLSNIQSYSFRATLIGRRYIIARIKQHRFYLRRGVR